jgi:hypothetical protein
MTYDDRDPRTGLPLPKQESRYFTAQVCLTGHTMTDAIEQSPSLMAKFCDTCGAATIEACPACGARIRGYYHVPNVFTTAQYSPPNHCHNCGEAFPWTKAKIAAAKEHAGELDDLSEDEKKQLQGAIDDLAAGGARTELAVTRFKKLMAKARQSVGSGLYKVAIDVASEAAKKALMG